MDFFEFRRQMRPSKDLSRTNAVFGFSETRGHPHLCLFFLKTGKKHPVDRARVSYARGDVFSAQVARTGSQGCTSPTLSALSFSPSPLARSLAIPATPLDTTNHPSTYETGEAVANYATRSSVFFGVATWHRDGDPDFPSPSPCFSHRCTRAFLNLLGPPSLYLVPIKLHPQRTLIAIIINYYYDNNNRIFIIYYFINFTSGKFNSLIIGISILF